MLENVLTIPNNSMQTKYQPYDFPNMDLKYQTSLSSNRPSHSPEIENNQTTCLSVSSVLPGTGNVAHNVTRMLGNSVHTLEKESTHQRTDGSPLMQYNTSHFLSFRQKIQREYTTSHEADVNHDYSESDNSASDMSISTERSLSPSICDFPPPTDVEVSQLSRTPSNANVSLSNRTPPCDSSPSSTDSNETETSDFSRVSDEDTENSRKQQTKSARTNFTKDQINALIKIFHDTPYPDSEMMENIGKDLNIKEKQVKIWFQNKRARWRRRVNDQKNNNTQYFLPTAPMMSPATPFGYMPTGHTTVSSPLHNFHGYMSFPWMQGYPSHNYSNQHFPRQHLANLIPPHYGAFNENTILKNNAYFAMNKAPSVSTMSSAQYGRTPQPQTSPNQISQSSQYPGYKYTST